MSIEVKALTKVFGTQTAVNNISLQINSGSIVGFLGPNGAGKSTTMKMITTYLPPTAGTVRVCGLHVEDDAIEVRKRIGYMPESNPLYYDMYVREYLAFAAGIHRLGNKSKGRIDEMMALTGLNKEVKKKIGALSKGYKQRVGLAQAMIHDPEVLILDEPTSGLDPNQLLDIRNLIKDIGKEKTVLLSTHIMQEVEAMCSRVIIINNGNIVADNSVTQIQHSGNENETILQVQFDKTIAPSQLEALKNIQQARPSGDNSWLLQTTTPDALRKELMAWAVNNDLVIVSMQTANESLEDVFRKLTK
jgi:ABC-2 type transport system ATP-binding protein